MKKFLNCLPPLLVLVAMMTMINLNAIASEKKVVKSEVKIEKIQENTLNSDVISATLIRTPVRIYNELIQVTDNGFDVSATTIITLHYDVYTYTMNSDGTMVVTNKTVVLSNDIESQNIVTQNYLFGPIVVMKYPTNNVMSNSPDDARNEMMQIETFNCNLESGQVLKKPILTYVNNSITSSNSITAMCFDIGSDYVVMSTTLNNDVKTTKSNVVILYSSTLSLSSDELYTETSHIEPLVKNNSYNSKINL